MKPSIPTESKDCEDNITADTIKQIDMKCINDDRFMDFLVPKATGIECNFFDLSNPSSCNA